MSRAHNGVVNAYPQATACPQCGNSASVHSIQELADLAKMQLGQAQSQPGGPPGAAQPGYLQEPRPGPLPGYMQEPRPGPPQNRAGGGNLPGPSAGGGGYGDADYDLVNLAMSGGAKLIGRMIGKRVQAAAGQAQATLAERRDAMLRAQIAIADKHPDICACLNDNVIFLAGGSRTLPMPNLAKLTVEQADELVATLRSG